MIPVPIVRDVDRAFPTTSALKGSIPGWDQIPEEFGTIKSFGRTRWNRLFNACFGMEPGMDWKRFGLLPNKEKGVVAAEAWRALEVLIGARDIKHEHKEAAWAYLASQWFVDARWETASVVEPFADADLEEAWLQANPRDR